MKPWTGPVGLTTKDQAMVARVLLLCSCSLQRAEPTKTSSQPRATKQRVSEERVGNDPSEKLRREERDEPSSRT